MANENDGQHRQRGGGGEDTGEKHRREPGTQVGESWGGGTPLRSVPKNADISTEHYVGGETEEHGENGRDRD